MTDRPLVERLAAWLAMFGPRQSVGVPYAVRDCPVARCLKAEGKTGVVVMGSTILWDGGAPRGDRASETVLAFINAVDYAGSAGARYITAGMAKRYLADAARAGVCGRR